MCPGFDFRTQHHKWVEFKRKYYTNCGYKHDKTTYVRVHEASRVDGRGAGRRWSLSFRAAVQFSRNSLRTFKYEKTEDCEQSSTNHSAFVILRPCIVGDTNVSPFARAGNICCGHKFCVRDTRYVSDFVQKHFVSATNVSQFTQHGNTTFILCHARLHAQETSWATISPQQCVLVSGPQGVV